MKPLFTVLAALVLAIQLLPVAAQDTVLSVDNASQIIPLATFGRGMARDVAWTASDEFLVASATDLWRYDLAAATPTPLFEQPVSLYGVAVNPAGDRLAVCDAEQITVYDYADLTERYQLAGAGCAEAPESLGFSPDGTTLASGVEGALKLWDAETGESRGVFLHSTDVLTITFMPDGRIVSRARDGLLRWWNGDAEMVRSLDVPALPAAISPDGALLATAESGELNGRYQPYVAITDLASGEMIQGLASPASRYAFVANNGVVTARDGQISLWDLASGEALATIHLPLRHTRQIAPSADGRHALVLGSNGVMVFDVEAQTVSARLTDHLARVEQLAFSPDGAHLGANTQADLHLWELATRNETAIHDSFPFSGFAFTPDGDLFTNGQEATLHRWTLTGERIESLEEGSSAQLVVLSPDGETAAITSHREDGAVILWNIEEERERFPLAHEDSWDEIADIAFSPDGQRVASATWFGSVSIWNRYGGAEIGRLGPYHDGPVEPYAGGLSFSPDSQWLYYTESGVGLIHRWNLHDRAEIEPLHADCDATTMDTAFAPQGRLLATACDHDVLLWDTDEARVVARLTGHSDRVMAVAFSPDGTLLASGSWDGTVRLWSLP